MDDRSLKGKVVLRHPYQVDFEVPRSFRLRAKLGEN